MQEKWREDPLRSRDRFEDNRRRVTAEQMSRYKGMTVAWAPDGSAVVDADAVAQALWQRLEQRGEDPGVFIYEFVPLPEMAFVCPLAKQPRDLQLPPKPLYVDGMLFDMWGDNRAKFPLEELERYHNMYVAWSPDGLRIVDADADPMALWGRLQKAYGDKTVWYRTEYIDPLDQGGYA